jgi:pimeloyl-ACP methyl ester carboxylesterase
MPFVERNGAAIHWSSLGKGEPVVLIMGLGCSSAMWFRIAPQMARRQRVILVDNRGSGLTRVPHCVVHRVRHMAADVAAVLDAAGEFAAHVVGFSMGGMIAQQFALDFPQRLRSLALLATHSGGPWVTQAEPQVRRLLFDKARMSAEDSMHAMRPYTYARDTPDELYDEDLLVRLANQPSARDYQAQLFALIGWSAYRDLERIASPTLVMHGLQDQLIPPVNGQRTAQRIACARLVELPDASHWLTTDQNAKVLAALREHIDRHTP